MVAMATIPMTHAAIFTTRLCNAASRRRRVAEDPDADSRSSASARWARTSRPFSPSASALSFFGPALPTLRDQTGATLGQLGLVFAAQSVGGLVGSIVAGRLYRRLGGPHLIAIAVLLLAGSIALLARRG